LPPERFSTSMLASIVIEELEVAAYLVSRQSRGS
jgi:hypothetical protein